MRGYSLGFSIGLIFFFNKDLMQNAENMEKLELDHVLGSLFHVQMK